MRKKFLIAVFGLTFSSVSTTILQEIQIQSAGPFIQIKDNLRSRRTQCTSQEVPVRDDYVYTQGIGSHKIYTNAKKWNEARKSCVEDGAHLAIINSKAEELLFANMLETEKKNIRNASDTKQIYVGIHDLFEECDWVTVFGEPLGTAGYVHWSTHNGELQPDGDDVNQDCGTLCSVEGTNGLNDVSCNLGFSYICELPTGC